MREQKQIYSQKLEQIFNISKFPCVTGHLKKTKSHVTILQKNLHCNPMPLKAYLKLPLTVYLLALSRHLSTFVSISFTKSMVSMAFSHIFRCEHCASLA